MRWLSLTGGMFLVGVAFFAATRVADTREGLVYEVITLLAALVGVGLILYGLLARASRLRTATRPQTAARKAQAPRVHSANELVIGSGGLVLAALLVGGLAATAGMLWAVLGLVVLLPMVAGCCFLCYGFARGPNREWKIDLQRLTGHR